MPPHWGLPVYYPSDPRFRSFLAPPCAPTALRNLVRINWPIIHTGLSSWPYLCLSRVNTGDAGTKIQGLTGRAARSGTPVRARGARWLASQPDHAIPGVRYLGQRVDFWFRLVLPAVLTRGRNHFVDRMPALILLRMLRVISCSRRTNPSGLVGTRLLGIARHGRCYRRVFLEIAVQNEWPLGYLVRRRRLEDSTDSAAPLGQETPGGP